MITEEQLLALLKDLESDRIERTISINNTDKFAKAICAFANDLPRHALPGYLLIGVKDDGSLNNLKVTDQLLQNLAALRSDGNIQPLPVIHVQKFHFPEGDVAVVEVIPSDMPPVRYQGQIWIRIGPRQATASAQEEKILSEKRTIQAKTFDAWPCKESTLNDLYLDLFFNYRRYAIASEVIEENHRDVSLQLASLRFFDLAKNIPTYAGLILFGKNPLYWLSGAYVQFLRINGTSLADEVISEKKLSGDLGTILRELDSLLTINVTSFPKMESALREKTVSDYPIVALRELLMNAVMHRNYESTAPIRFYWFNDHVEIQNPGGLYGEASEKNFPYQNAYRNPVIAEAMKVLGYVNRFGHGVLQAKKALENNGNRVEFTFNDSYVLANVIGKAME